MTWEYKLRGSKILTFLDYLRAKRALCDNIVIKRDTYT